MGGAGRALMGEAGRGRFVVFEGWDASGKSTQARRLAERLGGILTHQPGATEVGQAVRDLVLHARVGIDPVAEALLFAADKAQHVAEVVGPALERGETVVCDRWTYSTLAYQGYGRELDRAALSTILDVATGGLEPDAIVLVRISVEEGLRRRGTDLDRIESADLGFHQRVVDGYDALAAADPARWVSVPGVGAVDDVHARILEALADRGLVP
jgi:dTMP kinase